MLIKEVQGAVKEKEQYRRQRLGFAQEYTPIEKLWAAFIRLFNLNDHTRGFVQTGFKPDKSHAGYYFTSKKYGKPSRSFKSM